MLSTEWVGSKWHPLLKVWEELQDVHSKDMQNSYIGKPLHVAILIFDFVLLPSFSSSLTQTLYSVYE